MIHLNLLHCFSMMKGCNDTRPRLQLYTARFITFSIHLVTLVDLGFSKPQLFWLYVPTRRLAVVRRGVFFSFHVYRLRMVEPQGRWTVFFLTVHGTYMPYNIHAICLPWSVILPSHYHSLIYRFIASDFGVAPQRRFIARSKASEQGHWPQYFMQMKYYEQFGVFSLLYI